MAVMVGSREFAPDSQQAVVIQKIRTNIMLEAIKDMAIDGTKRLTSDNKKALSAQIENVFREGRVIGNERRDHAKRDAVSDYKKALGMQTKIDDMNALESRRKAIEAEIEELGFSVIESGGSHVVNSDGRYGTTSLHLRKKPTQAQARAHAKLVKVINSVVEFGDQEKAKCLVRMQLAETRAEGCVIMRELLGNGTLPDMSDQLPALPAPRS